MHQDESIVIHREFGISFSGRLIRFSSEKLMSLYNGLFWINHSKAIFIFCRLTFNNLLVSIFDGEFAPTKTTLILSQRLSCENGRVLAMLLTFCWKTITFPLIFDCLVDASYVLAWILIIHLLWRYSDIKCSSGIVKFCSSSGTSPMKETFAGEKSGDTGIFLFNEEKHFEQILHTVSSRQS